MSRVTMVGALCALTLLAAGGGCASEADTALPSAPSGGPVVAEDHWHAAFGVYVCDEFLPDGAAFDSPEGIHTHDDGVIHIHPFSEAGAGGNATLGLYLSGAGIELADGELAVDGETYGDDAECDGEPAVVQVARWSDVRSGDDPEIVDRDAADLRFEADGEGYTVAVVAEGEDIPPPPSTDVLDELDAVDPPEGAAPDDPDDDGSGDLSFDDVPASGGGVVAQPGFRPVLAVVPPSASDGACGRDQLGGLDGQCYELGDDGPGLDAVATARSALPEGDPSGGPVVEVELTDAGLDEFNALAAECHELTAVCPMGQVAIVADDVVVSAPTIVVPEFDADDILISGDFDTDDTETIADALAR
jgi:hypothetical protein